MLLLVIVYLANKFFSLSLSLSLSLQIFYYSLRVELIYDRIFPLMKWNSASNLTKGDIPYMQKVKTKE